MPDSDVSAHFDSFRKSIIGIDTVIETPFGPKPLIYADWTAMGRSSTLVDCRIHEVKGWLANTHTDANFAGERSTQLYHESHEVIRSHVGGSAEDKVLFKGSGMTAAVNWFQRMLGLKDSGQAREEKPVIVITHMEHHSNQTSWDECDCDVRIIRPTGCGLPDLNHLEEICRTASSQGRKILGSITACSNVTGIMTDYHGMAKIIHAHDGRCVVDAAACAPYVKIDMHPMGDPAAALDGVFFSPHKFLGGPGASGVIVFNSSMYERQNPVDIGGGIVGWTNPWGGHSYYLDIEVREDAGTPPILQSYQAALCAGLKEALDPEKMKQRKEVLLERAFNGLEEIEGIGILEPSQRKRQGIISFTTGDLHYSLMVRLLSDLFGIQVRGGCSCAGTLGHFLFNIDEQKSKEITDLIDSGDNSQKPGWVRISLHPTMTDPELETLIGAIGEIMANRAEYSALYKYDCCANNWSFRDALRVPSIAPISSYFF